MVDILSSEILYRGRVFNLRVETARMRGGHLARWEIIDHPGGVAVVPLDDQERVLLVRQYRPGTGATMIEIPAGTLEVGESAEVAAMRELREETGMRAELLEKLTECYLAPGYSTELMHVFLAAGLSPAPLPSDSDEEISVERMDFDELLLRVNRGEIKDAKTIAGTLLAAQRLRDSREATSDL